MQAELRRERILEIARQNGGVDIEELHKAFDVSRMTVRRDLDRLAKSGFVTRTYGGAVIHEKQPLYELFEQSFEAKMDQFVAEKKAIARYAVQFIADNDSIFLDGGTTTWHITNQLSLKKNLTVITNSLSIAMALSKAAGLNLIMVGGTYRPLAAIFMGPLAEEALAQMHIDKLFVAVEGITIDAGLTVPDMNEAHVKRAMVAAAREVIVVADHSKFGVKTLSSFASIDSVHRIITDVGIAPEQAALFRENGVEVIVTE